MIAHAKGLGTLATFLRMSGAGAGRGRLETILEAHRVAEAHIGPIQPLELENEPLGSPETSIDDRPRVPGTPDFDPSAPIPYVLTARARELLAERSPDELTQEDELEEELETDSDPWDDDDDDGDDWDDWDDDDELEGWA